MYTKSLIQQNIEIMHLKESFFDGLSNIMEKYNVDNCVFSMGKELYEVTKGYFVVENEYDNMEDVMKNYNLSKGVRIINNKTFQIGTVYEHLSQCPADSTILDIEIYEDVR